MVIGDFDAFLHASENQSKRPPQYAQVEAFREALDSCQLQDLGYRGYPFTWSNKRPGDANTKIRLDKGVANEEWRVKFQMSTISHLSTHASDHLPIASPIFSASVRSFKFEEAWLLSNECEEVVQEAWGRSVDESNGLQCIKNKNHACGMELSNWGSARTDEAAIKELQKRLDRLNEAENTEENKAEFLDVSKQMDDLLQKQEIYWAQRSGISWMKHGDRKDRKSVV